MTRDGFGGGDTNRKMRQSYHRGIPKEAVYLFSWEGVAMDPQQAISVWRNKEEREREKKNLVVRSRNTGARPNDAGGVHAIRKRPVPSKRLSCGER